MSNFYSLDVVGIGSETQFQTGENLNYMILRAAVCNAGPIFE